jgi:hypothetical protein
VTDVFDSRIIYNVFKFISGKGFPLTNAKACSMRRHNFFLILFLSLFLATGCTSKKVDQENTDVAEMTGDADVAAADGAEAAEGGEEVSEITDDFGDDAAAPAEGGTEVAEGGAATDELDGLDGDIAAEPDAEGAADTAAADAAAPADDTGLQELATTDEPTAPPADIPADSATGDTASTGMDEAPSYTEEPAPKPVIPLQKMMTTPFTKNGVLLNALYVARPGDTVESVSQKIYGMDKSEELKSNNAVLGRRGMKVGDKVYYNSPQRPGDSSQILTYYEDVGLAPEIYLSKSGDNIRTVAKSLLGNENSWKEIWSTNLEVESKDELAEGTRLRYWGAEAAGTAAPVVAATTPPASPEDTMAPPPPAEVPPPMPDQAAVEAVPPPPPPDMSQAEPPPPAIAEVSEPPPPAEPPAAGGDAAALGALGEDPDQMMALGAGAILLIAAIALFIIIRKKRARRSGIDFQTATHTQIE